MELGMDMAQDVVRPRSAKEAAERESALREAEARAAVTTAEAAAKEAAEREATLRETEARAAAAAAEAAAKEVAEREVAKKGDGDAGAPEVGIGQGAEDQVLESGILLAWSVSLLPEFASMKGPRD